MGAQSNPYTRPAAEAGETATRGESGTPSAIPYADGSLPTTAAKPSGLHSAGSLESKTEPASAPSARPAGTETPAASNPYARPLSAAPSLKPEEKQGEAATTRRRSTRMQRYHAAGGDEEGGDA